MSCIVRRARYVSCILAVPTECKTNPIESERSNWHRYAHTTCVTEKGKPIMSIAMNEYGNGKQPTVSVAMKTAMASDVSAFASRPNASRDGKW